MTKAKEQPKVCYFCVQNKKVATYTEPAVLRRFISSYMKISPRRRSGLCAKHQRRVATAVKRARVAGLLPFVPR